MSLDDRDRTHPAPPSTPLSLRTAFIQRRGFPPIWRAAVAAVLGLVLLIGALLYFGVVA